MPTPDDPSFIITVHMREITEPLDYELTDRTAAERLFNALTPTDDDRNRIAPTHTFEHVGGITVIDRTQIAAVSMMEVSA